MCRKKKEAHALSAMCSNYALFVFSGETVVHIIYGESKKNKKEATRYRVNNTRTYYLKFYNNSITASPMSRGLKMPTFERNSTI